ncbi:nuclear transport factor 2 family protein [Trujillonella endophytica]|uniref:SnoaL-like domain-containing protein n=1 Tax=Trujillonella endophytica TaxID=673521 RepID=A0A1H8PGI6_9ACTN|nr:nuclear transport factor 2 family protein [Trujillella endophytica]SEO40911.1 SnoaL-like domain-containing protein [Trujillella endophytica]
MTTIAEERDEILQLLYRYNHTIDDGDAGAWADTWTEDGVFEGVLPDGARLTGREQLVGFASQVHGMRHVIANPVVDLDGDAARVRAYVFAIAAGRIIAAGAYDDTVVRTAAGWRFARRRFTPDPTAA